MHMQRERWKWRTTVVIATTILVVGYCFGIMAYVQTSPDIGLHCTFFPVVGRVFPQFLRTTGSETVPDLYGCRIEKVGPYAVESWPQYLRALRLLQQSPANTNTAGTCEVHGDEEWVRVVLRRGPDSQPFSVWCVLGHAPLEVMLPALLWLVLEVGLFGVGAIVFWQRPEDRAAGPFFALTIVAVGAYMGGYHWLQIVSQPVLEVIFVLSAVLLPAVSLHFQCMFPRPKAWLQRWPQRSMALIYGPPLVPGVAIVAGYFYVRSLTRAESSAAEISAAMAYLR